MVVQSRRLIRRPVVAALAVLAVVALAAAALLLTRTNEEATMTIDASTSPAMAISTDDLATVARTKVYFGHQSVGENILTAVPAVFARQGVAPPPIEQEGTAPGPEGGFIDHQFIGENGDPLLKIKEFDRVIRGGIGDEVNVAAVKLCYIDITTATGVDELFAAYRDTIAGLERDYPNVAFLHLTVPLTTESSFKAKIKTFLGGSDRFSQAENVTRERLNALIRAEYAGNNLFDIAAVQATAPDGTETAGSYKDQQYYSLYSGYASDLGHLNTVGSEIAATAFLKAIAQASSK